MKNYRIKNSDGLMMKNNPAIGLSWEEARQKLFTPEEIAESNLRVAVIGKLIKHSQEKGISQKFLEEMTRTKSFWSCRDER